MTEDRGPHIEDFATFFARSRDPVLRAVFVSTGDLSRSEDAVAEAYVRACGGWRKLSKHPNPVGWVTTVALNEFRSGWRRRSRERRLTPPDSFGEKMSVPFDPQLLALVAALPERQREVLALRLLLDQDTEQTAAVLGIAPGTVTAHLYRATSSLRAELTNRQQEVEP